MSQENQNIRYKAGYCCVCDVVNYAVSCHRFPKNENIRNRWLSVLNINPNKVSFANSRVCGLHFHQSCFSKTAEQSRTLLYGSLPDRKPYVLIPRIPKGHVNTTLVVDHGIQILQVLHISQHVPNRRQSQSTIEFLDHGHNIEVPEPSYNIEVPDANVELPELNRELSEQIIEIPEADEHPKLNHELIERNIEILEHNYSSELPQLLSSRKRKKEFDGDIEMLDFSNPLNAKIHEKITEKVRLLRRKVKSLQVSHQRLKNKMIDTTKLTSRRRHGKKGMTSSSTNDGTGGGGSSSSSKYGRVKTVMTVDETAAQIQWSDLYDLNTLPDVGFDDFDQICRTCLSRSSELTSLFSFGSTTCPATLYQMLQTCLSYRLRKKDALLPQKICSSCILELTRSFAFRERCRTVHDKLSRVICIAEETNASNFETNDETVIVKAELQHDDNNDVCYEDSKVKVYRLTDNDLNDPDDEDVDEVIILSAENDAEDILLEDESRLTASDDKEDVPRLRRRRASKRKKSSVERTHVKLVIPWKCRECDCLFDYRYDMSKHLRTAKHAPSHSFECQDCLKQMHIGMVRQHERSHTKEILCKVCGKAFTRICNLTRHMMGHTGERPHVCDLCGKGFIQMTSLNAHLRICNNATRAFVSIRPKVGPVYNCTQCGRGYKSSSRYEFHLKNHHQRAERRKLPVISLPPLVPPVEVKVDDFNDIPTPAAAQDGIPTSDDAQVVEEEKHKCSICGRNYKDLKSHMLRHNEKNFLCSDCGKFVTKAALQSHLRVHSGVRPHKCTFCGKGFSQIGSFESHVLTHTGEKPFSCNICNRSFRQLTHLKYHLRIHNGEKPYECNYCGKAFALKGNLTVHVRTHTGETPYICLECNKGFYDGSSLKKHQRSHSSGNVVINRKRRKIDDVAAPDSSINVESDENSDMSEQYQQDPHTYSTDDHLTLDEKPVFDLKYTIAQR